LGAQSKQLDPSGLRSGRVFTLVYADLRELCARRGKRALGFRQSSLLGRELRLCGVELGGKLLLLGLEREQARSFLAQIELKASDRIALSANLGELVRGLCL
jgi:hypothetical protein